ncbi:DUF6141 family protein [Sediminibacillus halophilus]|uniref:Uncharacterized protein n=1 Tax=Sediminibacillus halophilus TaxID=482461 RepID=A0A1G9NHI1_9BACI|nr:DUF6141 family protein [Sediminibacillus halophilus]SDL85833.1 hypothetical protein SAMN05216244_1002 [Sediminibacillus halophilus]
MTEENKFEYREVQRPRQVWLWGFILLDVAFMWYWFIQQIIFDAPIGSNPAPDAITIVFWLIFGITIPMLFGLLRLIVEVHKDGIYIRFSPFHFQFKKYLLRDLHEYERITYNSLKQFGGWGIRRNAKGEIAYNLGGKQGIVLKLKDNTVIIGTQKPEELKKLLDSVVKHNEN